MKHCARPTLQAWGCVVLWMVDCEALQIYKAAKITEILYSILLSEACGGDFYQISDLRGSGATWL